MERKVMNVHAHEGRLHASAHVERVYLIDFINDAIPVHLLASFVVVEGAGDVLMQDQLHIESRLVAKDVHFLVVLVAFERKKDPKGWLFIGESYQVFRSDPWSILHQ
jgi:hypothetical protein